MLHVSISARPEINVLAIVQELCDSAIVQELCDSAIVQELCDSAIVQELCESRGGRPGLFRPNEPSGFRGRKAILKHASALVSACA